MRKTRARVRVRASAKEKGRTRRNLTVPSDDGGDRKLYLLLKLGLTAVEALGFAAARSARPDAPSTASSSSRLPTP
jgi:hypothetical protein